MYSEHLTERTVCEGYAKPETDGNNLIQHKPQVL